MINVGPRALALTIYVGLLFCWTAATQARDVRAMWEDLTKEVVRDYQTGDFSSALSAAEKAVAIAREAFGDRDPATLRSLTDGVLLTAVGKYQEAEKTLRETLTARLELHGVSDFGTQTSMNDLAEVLRYEGNYRGAEDLYRAIL